MWCVHFLILFLSLCILYLNMNEKMHEVKGWKKYKSHDLKWKLRNGRGPFVNGPLYMSRLTLQSPLHTKSHPLPPRESPFKRPCLHCWCKKHQKGLYTVYNTNIIGELEEQTWQCLDTYLQCTANGPESRVL